MQGEVQTSVLEMNALMVELVEVGPLVVLPLPQKPEAVLVLAVLVTIVILSLVCSEHYLASMVAIPHSPVVVVVAANSAYSMQTILNMALKVVTLVTYCLYYL